MNIIRVNKGDLLPIKQKQSLESTRCIWKPALSDMTVKLFMKYLLIAEEIQDTQT